MLASVQVFSQTRQRHEVFGVTVLARVSTARALQNGQLDGRTTAPSPAEPRGIVVMPSMIAGQHR
jgi:hypothetical protein